VSTFQDTVYVILSLVIMSQTTTDLIFLKYEIWFCFPSFDVTRLSLLTKGLSIVTSVEWREEKGKGIYGGHKPPPSSQRHDTLIHMQSELPLAFWGPKQKFVEGHLHLA
jgi:hypothetical protein